MVRLLSLLFLVLQSISVLSQDTNCEQTLSQATAEFDAGRFYNLPSILKPCLDNGFSKEQKVRSYLLLTQSYLILHHPLSAEHSYLQLITADPEFAPNLAPNPVALHDLR